VAEDFDEKTEAPTPRRREEARERGQVVKSTDLTASIALLGAMVSLNYFGPDLLREMIGMTRQMLTFSISDAIATSSMQEMALTGLIFMAKLTIPVCLIMTVVAVVITMAQVGFMLTFHPLMPSFSKINPISGFQRMLSMESAIKMGLNLIKVGLIGVVAYMTIKSKLGQILNLSGMGTWQIVGLSGELIFMLGVRMAVVLLVLAIFDYGVTWFQNEKKLRMSKQELKEEMRRMEGDPLVKERRRRVARQLMAQRMQHAVPKADVVITNPTELAIALKYDSETMAAPKVIAKGADHLAARIRQIAIKNGIPIVERKPLARAIYKTVEVGQEIPPAYYKAIAEILAYVYELTGKAPKSGTMGSTATKVPQTQRR
jgi:flagellar biosynthetic protein FlhB